MVKKIRKAVITAAGSGSRLLPLSKEIPKEMLPYCTKTRDGRLVLKPILEAAYESLCGHGCREFCFVVGHGKRIIKDYFVVDDSAKYATNSDLQDFYKNIRSTHIEYVQQPSPYGFGDAVLRAKSFVGNDNFVLHAGDDVVLPPSNKHIQRLVDAFFSNDADLAFLVDSVEKPEQYGIIEGRRIGRGLHKVECLEEKPRRPKSNLAVVATYVFKPSIFSELEKAEQDRDGELQLSDAIKPLIAHGRCIAVELEARERRIDVGTPEGYVACIRDSFEISNNNTNGGAFE